MKNILKNIAFLLVAGLTLISCDYDETNFEKLTKDYTASSEYYVQFADADRHLESSVDEDGNIVDIETTVDVVLLGSPQSQDVTVNLNVDPSSTIDPSMYNLSSTSVTIPAGETSGSVTLTTNTEEMPVAETLDLNMSLDAGEHNATAGTTLHYELRRIAFCPLENGAADLAGSYSVTENIDGYENGITALESDGDLLVSGIGEDFINNFWAEQVIAGGDFTMEVAGNGVLTIPRQYLFTTTYEGTPYRYEIEGSGVWRNCGDDPVLEITYDIYYEGDADGLAKTYSSYLPAPYLKAVFTRN